MSVHVPSLVHTAFAGDVSGVESLISSGIDVNQSRGPRGTTALHAATYMNHVGVVSLLLKHGASVQIRDGGQWTALHIASSKGFLPIIEALIANGSELTAVLDVGGKKWNATTLFGTSKHISPPLTTEEIQQGRAVMWHARHSYEDAHTHTQLKRVFGLCLCGFKGAVKGIAPDARPVACSHGVAAGQVAPDPAHHHHAPILGTSPDQHYDQHHHHAPILGTSPHLHKDGHDLHSPVFGDEQDKKLVELSQTAPAPEPTHQHKHQHQHQHEHQHLETSPTSSSSTTTKTAAAAAAVAAVAAEMAAEAAEASAETRAAAPAAPAAVGGAFSLGALFGWGRHKTAPPPQEQEEEQQSEYVDDYGWISVK